MQQQKICCWKWIVIRHIKHCVLALSTSHYLIGALRAFSACATQLSVAMRAYAHTKLIKTLTFWNNVCVHLCVSLHACSVDKYVSIIVSNMQHWTAMNFVRLLMSFQRSLLYYCRVDWVRSNGSSMQQQKEKGLTKRSISLIDTHSTYTRTHVLCSIYWSFYSYFYGFSSQLVLITFGRRTKNYEQF